MPHIQTVIGLSNWLFKHSCYLSPSDQLFLCGVLAKRPDPKPYQSIYTLVDPMYYDRADVARILTQVDELFIEGDLETLNNILTAMKESAMVSMELAEHPNRYKQKSKARMGRKVSKRVIQWETKNTR